MHHGRDKHFKTEIPKKIRNSEYKKDCLRGIFDTDGSYFLSTKKGCKGPYPCIEISTCSPKLTEQITRILKERFRVKTRINKNNAYKYGSIYRISLNGKKETERWFKEIGSSNSYKFNKFKSFKYQSKSSKF